MTHGCVRMPTVKHDTMTYRHLGSFTFEVTIFNYGRRFITENGTSDWTPSAACLVGEQ